ncbi:lasso RiPP family leader peptide-containing protein [Rhodococcus sp. BP-349]|nr:MULTISPECIES: lasso RiPP family leader peptide-containing protein [unclassified Rhodococcus (in: high G+C Gram-positive bacteria)]MBY6539459.1 lasso RiPP family leader peptide-containing protein [Rhodococcus sp. BP-363]MBY6544213.1 lasso RiPP family leader peptide-containing protein [Rhodococcus sp. BP-369]MBY6563443.1 lasso RiPP family leader peptide-containing protein [Rhodococcus sp. BP-370]MBY6577735.1 lasso RiPP family leader peptide-containing protein [Rhodococcus sp. BP-364]MBY658703
MASYNAPQITDLGTLAELTLAPGKSGGKTDGAVFNNIPLGGELTFS